MDELEGEILALFGEGGRELRRGENNNKRNKNSSESEDLSDDYGSRKRPNQSVAKVTKVESQDGYDSDPIDLWGPDLIGDEEDRARLDALPEIEREKILEERQEQRDLLWEKRELRRKLDENIKAGSVKVGSSDLSKRYRRDDYDVTGRSYSGSSTRLTKSARLNEMRRLREEKKSKSRRSLDKSNSRHLAEYNSDEDEELDIDNKSSSESRNVLIDEPLISLSDLNTIWLSQDLVDKWIYTPMFSKAVTGAYVKVQANKDGKGPYTVAQVTGVLEDSTPYFLKRHYVDVRLRVCVGDNRIDVEVGALSNTPITTAEYQQLEALRQKDPDSLMEYPVQKIFEKKKQDISEKNEYIITSKDIDHRVNMFKKAGAGADSEIQKRAELSRQYQIARQNEDHEKMEQIRREMNDLPSSRLSNKSQSSFAYNSRVSKIGVSRPQSFLNSKPAVKLGASLPSARNSANNSAVNLQSQKFRQPTNAPTQNIVQNQPSQSTDNQYLAHLPYADTDVPADTDNELGPTPGTSGSHNLIFKSNNPKNPKLELPLPTRKNKNYAKIMACASFDLSFVK
ncbi:hypothetical protein BB560_004842 [Smittium megazygosporum]|uniref:Plus3 domain-containing protein n=1 Tax=Smittium megazygosporum TaxID=133381 RepID=A0A2T9Z849_9FUNG|nr:hypothetical protein BB560_004842 [Smittium megazygosporum]